ncbi:hypothetical protein ACLKA7_010601 [Drosophila subpalustris]
MTDVSTPASGAGACEQRSRATPEAPAESASTSTSTSRPLTNGAKKAPQPAIATATTTPGATTATTSNQAKLERHLQSNNNQHAAAETATTMSTAPKVSADKETSNLSSSPSLTAKCSGSKSAAASQQDVDEVARLFEEKPEAFEKWLTERAPPEALSRLHEFIESHKSHNKRPSVTSDLFQQWMASPIVQQVSLTHNNF